MLLRPLVRFCLRRGIYLQEAYDCLKEVMLEEARQNLREAKVPFNKSRISAMTGLQRKEISRLAESGTKAVSRTALIGKLIGQWQNDPTFTTKTGAPRVLRLSDDEHGFSALVRAVSQDLNSASVLFELLRVGAVTKRDDRVQLQVRTYVPSQSEEASYELLAGDMGFLVQSVEENILHSHQLPNLHLTTRYDRIRAGHETEIRAWIIQEGHEFHARVREYLSKFDQDLTPTIGYTGEYRRVSVASFSVVLPDREDS